MEKLFFILLILFCNDLTAQNIVNGDFVINSGNDDLGASCPTFSNTSVPNWKRSHGTPDFSAATNIYMWGQHEVGEGIVGGYQFRKGETYCIELGLYFWNFPGGNLNLFACTGLVQNLSTVGCGHPPPSPTVNQRIFSGNTFSTVNYILFTPNADYEELWIWPDALGPQYASGVIIDYVKISLSCPEVLTFNDGPITPGTHEAGYINVGTYYGGVNTVTITYNNVTTLTAANEVMIMDDFLAVSHPVHSVEAVFIAEIGPCSICDPKKEEIEPREGEGGQGGPGQRQAKGTSSYGNLEGLSLEGDLQEEYKMGYADMDMIRVYPNPVTDRLSISYSCKENGELRLVLKDAKGQILKTENVRCAERDNVDYHIDVSGFVQGIYFLELTLGKERIFKKIVKM